MPGESEKRFLVRKLSSAAAKLDRSLLGPPIRPATGFDYSERQKKLERQAKKELIDLRDTLEKLEL